MVEVRSQLEAKLKDRNARRAELLRRESARVASDREARVTAAAERVAATAADRQTRARAAPTARPAPPVRPDDDARDARRLAFAHRRRASRRDAAAADRAAARAAADARWDRINETAAVDADERRRRRSSDSSASNTAETIESEAARRQAAAAASRASPVAAAAADDAFEFSRVDLDTSENIASSSSSPSSRREANERLRREEATPSRASDEAEVLRDLSEPEDGDGRRGDAAAETDDVTVKPGGVSWSSPAKPRARAFAVDDAAAKAAEAAAVEHVKVASGGVAWHSPARAGRPSKLAAARMRRDAAKAEAAAAAAAAAARATASIGASSLERKSAATTMQSAWRRRVARRAAALARVAADSPGVPTRGVPTRRSALLDENEGTALGEAGRELEREGSWSLAKVAGEVVVTPRGSRSAASAGPGSGPGSARRSRGHTYSALGTFDTDSPISRAGDDEVESKRSAWRGEVVSALGARGASRATRDVEAAETKTFANASTAEEDARAMGSPAGSSVVDESEAPASLAMVDVLAAAAAAAAAATSPRRRRRPKTRREKKLGKLPFAAAGAAIRGVKRAGGGLVRGVGGGLLRGVGGLLRGLRRRREDHA